MTQTVLSAENIRAGYFLDLDIVSDCSVRVDAGELVGIIGPNGAGKSTMLKVVFGLLPVRSGKILFGNRDITNLAAHKLVSLGIGFVPQTHNIFPSLSVYDNLRMGAYRDSSNLDERIEKVFALFPKLKDYLKTRAGLLSGGEAQMVAIGRALIMSPSLLLLDEPSAGLSPANQKIAFDNVAEVVSSGISVLMVEQNARTCLEICDRAYVMENGANAYSGTGEDLLNNPKVAELYLGSLAKYKK